VEVGHGITTVDVVHVESQERVLRFVA